MHYRILVLAPFVQMAFVLPASADALSAGQQVATAFLVGDIEAVWAASAPEMQQTFGSSEALAAFRTGLEQSLGTEEAVLSERIDASAGYETFIRVSRWSGAPTPIQMVIAFDGAGKIAGFAVQPQPVAAASTKLDYTTQAPLRLPADGDWYVFWGGREIEDNYHAANAGQRFAVDLVVRRDGQSHSGDAARLDSYYCWGRPILAPADGIVASAVDGLPDQAIGSSDPANPAGNHVVMDFGNGEYGFLAHLQKDSLSVQKGQQIKAGQEIGRCGNSGNSSEPHLHFHLQTSPTLGEGEGLPAQFTNYRANGTLVPRGEPKRGETIQPAE